jgi:5-methyltetrahydrofolate--homocysteine methyltransferase
MRMNILEALKERVLLADGAIGTELQKAGLEPGGCVERWNIDHPERLLAIQRAYAEAGSDCISTNTFGASRITLQRHGLDDQLQSINENAVRIARQALGERPGFVLGDIGPLGGLLEPYGDISEHSARDALTEQASALVEAGVDAVLTETQTSLEELGIAVAAAREVGAPCIIASVAFDVIREGTELRTMMGVDPEGAARFMSDAGVDVLGVNCGAGVHASWTATALRRYRSVCDLPTLAQPNAGQPELENLQVVYRQDPDSMGDQVEEILDAGARILGGCCGTTPEHIRRFRIVVDKWNADGT